MSFNFRPVCFLGIDIVEIFAMFSAFVHYVISSTNMSYLAKLYVFDLQLLVLYVHKHICKFNFIL